MDEREHAKIVRKTKKTRKSRIKHPSLLQRGASAAWI
jgi:hypothetical protein